MKIKINKKIILSLGLTGFVLIGCGKDNLKRVDSILPEKIMTTMRDENQYPGLLDYEFIDEVNTLKIKLNMLEVIYDAKLNFLQAEKLTEDINLDYVSVEDVQKMIKTAKQPISLVNRKKNDEKYETIDKLNYIKEKLENELLNENCYETVESIAKRTIKMEVADAARCHPAFINISPRINHNDYSNYTVVVERNDSKETYIISQSKAPRTHQLLDYLYTCQLEKEGILMGSKEKQVKTYQKMINYAELALIEGLSLQDNNLIAKNTKKTVNEKLENLNCFANSMSLEMYNLGTDSSKVIYKIKK